MPDATDRPTLYDPTRIDIFFDPREMRMSGIATHGHTPFDVPYISHVVGNLWQGGCASDLLLPYEIEHLVSLYKWEAYRVEHTLRSSKTITAYDSDVPDSLGGMNPREVAAIADHVLECMKTGPTLVHCQAGLIAAVALVRGGLVPNGDAAIELLREKRSPAVLCNPRFERFVRTL